ncbi:hypothetical protein Y032_0938g3123 [Ancylostoma ceylanicum]|uniref:Uncharacterized protein n=1 Tax=Ancylostoma ceylanicum TaxID=53326 RepID=A0A016WAR1_9BILA|nr:hypothetical protein Y032_0938g3123 [Ancylostoma ceylanicum]
MAIHNSRISRCLFSHPNHAWLRYKSAYKIDYDFIKFAEREVEQAKGYPRGEGGRFRRCAYLLYENHLKNALSNKKQIISVIGGPVKDSKEAVEYFKTVLVHLNMETRASVKWTWYTVQGGHQRLGANMSSQIHE